MPTDTDPLTGQPTSTLDPVTDAIDDRSTIDKLTGTTAEDRQAFIAKAKDTLDGAVASAVDAVKANPKAAAAIAAGATVAVAGAAYGATKLGSNTRTPSKPRATAKRAPAKRAPAKRSPAKPTPSK